MPENITKKEADQEHRDIWKAIREVDKNLQSIALEHAAMGNISEDIREIKTTLGKVMEEYVKKEDNKLVRNIIFGLVAIIVMAVVNAWMAQILR